MNNQYYLTNRVLRAGFNINLESHHIDHINSKLTITPEYLEIEKIQVKNIMKDLTNIYARLKINMKLKIKQCFQPALISKMKNIKY